MKKILIFIFILTFSFVLFGCDEEVEKIDPTNTKEVWEKFDKTLQLTSSLQYYAIDTVEVINGQTVHGKLIYTTNDLGETVAYKEKGNSKFWWYDGLTYFEEDGKKLKKASNINEFLEISESEFNWTYEMASDIKMEGNTISFSIALGGFNTCNVETKVGKNFIEEITVMVTMIENEQTVSKSLTYRYVNPGKKPEVSLPENINEYQY